MVSKAFKEIVQLLSDWKFCVLDMSVFVSKLQSGKLQDFYVTKGGERKLIVPKVMWNRLNLRDMDSYTSTLTGLLATQEAPGKVSDQLLFETLDVDYEEERKRRRIESVNRAIETMEVQAIGKMTLEELQTLDCEKPIIDAHKGEPMPAPSPEQGPPLPGGPGGGGGGLSMPGGGGGGSKPKPPKGGGGAPPMAPPGVGGAPKPPAPPGPAGGPPAGGPPAPAPGPMK
jgi:hypothetical protein